MVNVSRRDFIKASILTGVVASLPKTGEAAIRILTPARAKPKLGEYTVPSICRMCVNSCGILIKVKDGKVHKIDGNPEHPANWGNICARGQSGVYRVYNPNRLKQPLLRRDKSKRGTWEGFEAVDWDTALDYIAERLESYINAGNASAIVIGGGWLPCGVYKPIMNVFAKTIGTPHSLGSPPSQCFFPKAFAWSVTIGCGAHPHIRADHENSRYIILLRRNLAGSIGVPYAGTFARSRKKGAKVVVLDPRLSESAAIADEWVPLRPGTDLAFLLAMGNVILEEKLIDEEFLKKYSNAPMLLDADTGAPVKLWDGDDGKKKYLVYDLAAGEAKSHDEAYDPALFGEYEVEVDGQTVRAKPALQMLKEKLESYSPEWAAEICDVPAETIRRIAEEFGTTRPAVIDPGWHDPKYENSVQTWRMVAILNALVGSIDRPGGLILNNAGRNFKSSPLPDVRVDVQWAMEKGIPVATAQANYIAFYDAVKEGKIKAFILLGANWIRTLSDDEKWKEVFSMLEDVIVIDILPNDTVAYADVILPDTTYPERDDILFGVGYVPEAAVATGVKAVDPLYGRPMIELIIEIVKRIGKFDKFVEVLASVLGLPDKEKLKSYIEREGIAGIRKAQIEAKGLDLDEMLTKGVKILKTRDQLIGTMPYQKPLGTMTGKVEIFSLKMNGIKSMKGPNPKWEPLPEWVPPKVYGKISESNVFYLTYGRSPITTHTQTTDNKLLYTVGRPEHFGLWINSMKAKELGISNGDLVRVTSLQTGRGGVTKAYVTDAIRPDTVFIVSAWGAESEKLTVAKEIGGLALNKLWPLQCDDMLPNAMTQEVLVKVEKA